MTAAVKRACGRPSPGSKVQAPSMLSAPLTLAVNQSSQEVTGQDVWGFRVTPRGEHSRDLHSPSFFLSQVITQEVHTETYECPACTRNNTVLWVLAPNVCFAAFIVIAWSCFSILLFCSHDSRMTPPSLITLVIFSGLIDRPSILKTPKWPRDCQLPTPNLIKYWMRCHKNVCPHSIQSSGQNVHLVLGQISLCAHF